MGVRFPLGRPKILRYSVNGSTRSYEVRSGGSSPSISAIFIGDLMEYSEAKKLLQRGFQLVERIEAILNSIEVSAKAAQEKTSER